MSLRSKALLPLAMLTDGVEHAGFMLVLVGGAVVRLWAPRRPARAVGRVVEQLYVQTVKSLLVVTVVGVFTGMVLALQTGEELRRYGAESTLAKIVAASLAREMGPFITAIILAATVGAAIAAELGTMKVSEEVDALELMNIDVVAFLVAPRIFALTLTAVVLTVHVDVVGVLGGAVIATTQYGMRWEDFLETARQTLAQDQFLGVSKDLYSGLVKAWAFGLVIGGLGCASGLRATGGALGVGRAVRSAVVASVVVTLIVGYLLTWAFWA